MIATNEADTSSPPPIDLEVLVSIYPDDELKRIKLLTKFSPQLVQLEQQVQNAIVVNDHKQGRFLAHKLKSSSKGIGAMALSDLCLKIEMAAKDSNNDLRQFSELLKQRATEVVEHIRSLR